MAMLKVHLVRPARANSKANRRHRPRQVKDWVTVDDIGRAERFQADHNAL